MLESGVNVVIATDGTAPDRNFDLLKDVKLFQFLHKGFFHDSTILNAGLVLEMITIRAAKAMGKDSQIGSLEVGKKADIIVLDCNRPHLAPFGIMPIQRIINHAGGSDVIHSIINGEIVMENRKLTKIDEKKVIEDARDAFNLMCERSKVLEYAVDNPKLSSVR